MTTEEATRILDPETTREALARYDPERRVRVVEEACRVVCDVLRAQQQPNAPLTLDELRKMDGPVWSAYKGGKGYWCLCKNGTIITPAGFSYDVAEIPHWVFYRRKPEEGTK